MTFIASAEVLAAGDFIDEGKVLATFLKKLLNVNVHLLVMVDSKDLFESLFTCLTSEDKSIKADAQLLRSNFETHKLHQLIWIPGATNIADPLAKHDSPMNEALQLILFDDTVPLRFTDMQARRSEASLG